MGSAITIGISLVSLAIAGLTAWWTIFRHGRLAMTRPSVVFFGFDLVPRETAKIFLRCLLYSTAVKGQVVEVMFAKLRPEDSERVFSFWGHGETTQLSPGSGLFVAQTGVALNHHFVLSAHEEAYEFLPGRYDLGIFAQSVGARSPRRVMALSIDLSEGHAAALRTGEGILFELDPVSGAYRGHSRPRAPAESQPSLGIVPTTAA